MKETIMTAVILPSIKSKREVIVEIYDKFKYDEDSAKMAEVTYKDVTDYEIYYDSEPLDADLKDDLDEYLTLHFADGDSATFRNSRVSLFIIAGINTITKFNDRV